MLFKQKPSFKKKDQIITLETKCSRKTMELWAQTDRRLKKSRVEWYEDFIGSISRTLPHYQWCEEMFFPKCVNDVEYVVWFWSMH